MSSVPNTLILAVFFAVAHAKIAPLPAELTLVSIDTGELRSQKRSLRAGDRLPPGVPLQLTGGAKAVLSAKGWGKLMLRGPAAFTARAKGDMGWTWPPAEYSASWGKEMGENIRLELPRHRPAPKRRHSSWRPAAKRAPMSALAETRFTF